MNRSARTRCALALVVALLVPAALEAVVLYDRGQVTIDGITLLRDKDDPTAYYYIPPYPRVSIDRETGAPEMLLALYVGDEVTSGGLFHFLFTLELPEDVVEGLRRRLEEEVDGAVLRGPVPLLIEKDDDEPTGLKPSFRVISSTLRPGGEVDSTLVTSGVAPITPGSRAAVAGRLDATSATLLQESLTGATSDVSVEVTAYYEAALETYEGQVFANLDTVYEHFLSLRNRQARYTKRELRSHVDELVRNGAVEVEVTDRAGLGGGGGPMAALLDLVTTKLVDMLFDTTTGLSKIPEQEKVPEDVVQGRQQRGYFLQVFGDNDDPKYVTDNQLTLRRREDVRRGTFSLRFSQNTTIKVPFNSSGNIRGFFEEWSRDSRVFKIVTPQDSVFERREVLFQVDPDYYDAFKSVINSASIQLRKRYDRADLQDFGAEVRFAQKDVVEGTFAKALTYPLLGLSGREANQYEYRVLWSFRGGQRVSVPEEAEGYLPFSGGVVDLAPPKDKVNVYVEVDDGGLAAARVRRASLAVEYRLLGRKRILTRSVRLGEEDENYFETSFIADEGQPFRYRTSWLLEGNRTIRGDWIDASGVELAVVMTGPAGEGGGE